MPSKSKSQQRFMGMVHAYKKGELKNASPEVKKVAKSMTKKSAHDFASTKHKGKPEKVKKETKVNSLIRKMVRETIEESLCMDLQTEACWKGYTQKGMKTMFGKKYPNCVKIKKKKTEGKLKEDYKNSEWEVYLKDEKGREKIVKKAKSKRAATILYNKIIKSDDYFEVGMRVVKEGKLTEDVLDDMIKQIGKRTFMYVGARKFAKGKSKGMQFIQFDVNGSKLGRGGRVLVYYNRGKDLYNVEGWKIRGMKAKKIVTKKDIYADRLARTIEDVVG